MHSLPDELLVHMCAFLCVATLARLRETCSRWHMIAADKHAWTNALHKYGGLWYELKNVVLADKFLLYGWSSPPSSSSVSANSIAFWGTLVDSDDRILATFGPDVPRWINKDFEDAYVEPGENDDTHCSFFWSTKLDTPLSWASAAMCSEYTKKERFVKAATVKMHVLAQRTANAHAYLTYLKGASRPPCSDKSC